MPFDPNASQLNQEQILQQVFDQANNALRTDAFVQVDTIHADLTVDIKASDGDNIAIANSDGSKFVTVTTVGPNNGLDVNVIQSSLPAGSATAANQVIGNASLASIDSKIPSGLTVTSTRLLVDGSGVIQPVSGTVTANQGTSPWVENVSQFGGSAVVTGTGNSGSGIPRITVSNDSSITNISGTISLPTGASTSANQTNGSQKTQIVDGTGTVIGPAQTISGTNYQPVVLAASATPGTAVVARSIQIAGTDGTNAQTISVDTTGKVNINNISGTISLPTGAATSANQVTANTSLASIDAGIPAALGQTTMAASMPVVIASNQTAISVTSTNLPTTTDTNYGTVGASTLRTASEIGNATGAAAFNAGTTTAQTLRVVLPTDQTAIPATQSGTWNINNISGTISLPTGAATSANQTTANTSLASIDAGIPATLGQTTKANSMPVVIPSDQIVVTNSTNITSNKIIYEDMTTIARGTTIAVGSFTTVYSYTGSGLLHGFSVGMTTATSNWLIRLLIDGTHDVFGSAGLLTDDMNSASIYNIPSIAQSPLAGINMIASATNFQWAGPNNTPITFSTSVSIQLKRLSTTKVFNGGLTVITKET